MQLFNFEIIGKMSGQEKIIYPAETPQDAFLNLLQDLMSLYGNEACSLLEQINTVPTLVG